MNWWEVQRWSREKRRPSIVVEEKWIAEKFAADYVKVEPELRRAQVVKCSKLPSNAIFRKEKEGSHYAGTKTGIFIEHRFYEIPVIQIPASLSNPLCDDSPRNGTLG